MMGKEESSFQPGQSMGRWSCQIVMMHYEPLFFFSIIETGVRVNREDAFLFFETLGIISR